MATPLARTVAALAVVAWAAGVWWGWKEFLVVAGSSMALLLIAIVFTIGRQELEIVVRVQPSRVVVGDRAAGELTIRNLRRRALRGVRVELPVGEAVARFALDHLKGERESQQLFMVPTNKRAVIPVGPVVTVKADPLELLRRTEQWGAVEEIYVHPKTTRLPSVTAGLIRDLEGVTTSALSSSDIAFHTLRGYVAGDDPRHVHWKSSAKVGDLLVRQYNDTRRSHVAVLLSTDLDEFGSDDEFELAVSCAASVATQAMRDEQTLTMIAGGQQFPIHTPTKLLDRFSGIEGRPGAGGIEECLRVTRRVSPDASVMVLCVGSTLEVNAVRFATNRSGMFIASLVLRAAQGGRANHLTVGDSQFVNIPDLASLNRGMAAVMGS